jgi:Regulator of chromosome condensation (RCC1) repeat
MFSWGKGNRGQLGRVSQEWDSTPSPITKVIVRLQKNGKPIYEDPGNIQQICAGMMHCAALDDENNVFVWGKHLLTKLPGQEKKRKKSHDAMVPVILTGLPPNLKIEKVTCGSHHTAVLMEDGSVWATGISKDTKELILDPICIVPAGVIDMPVRYFAAHMDRTTIIGFDGRQVFQVHLWSDPEYREWALFTPVWIQNLLDSDPKLQIREVHRSWMHSVAVTD